MVNGTEVTGDPAPRVWLAGAGGRPELHRLGLCSLSHLLQRGVGFASGFESLLCCPPAGRPWTSYFISLSLSVFICYRRIRRMIQ